jgi:hypothetical protein
MRYQYRWFYAAAMMLLLIAAGYFEVIAPEVRQLILLNMREQELKDKIHASSRIVTQVSGSKRSRRETQKEELSWLQDLSGRVHLSGLSLEAVRVISSHNLQMPGSKTAQLVVQGGFPQMMALLSAADKEDFSTQIQDFVIRLTAQDQLQMNMMIVPRQNADPLTESALGNVPVDSQGMHNSFCMPEIIKDKIQVQDASESSHVPLALIKMIGYVHQGGRAQALALLPDHRMIPVSVWSEIGKEHGIVAAIQPDRMVINVPGKKKLEVKLSQ